ncbi:MAG TPA: hypothetical protein VMY78_16125 [Solirubrobacteraceae bacterium]|nr:hypothetical protein [Solirubrobacteraceae bacterium]
MPLAPSALPPVTPARRTCLAWLTALLVLPVGAAPAEAKQTVRPTEAGGVELLDTVDAGGTTTGDLLDRPGDDAGLAQQPGGSLPEWLQPGEQHDPDSEPPPPPVTSTYVNGPVARIRADGKAAIPLGAPRRVRRLISQYNRIAGKRYKWGGGHGVLEDRGYDCSGAVGYGLVRTGMLNTTMVSGSFARWAAVGSGRWVTIYANRSHVYTEVAGLRLDTSSVGDRGGASGVRWRPVIGKRSGFEVRHPIGL